MLKSLALFFLEGPIFLPAITKVVFFDILLEFLPPCSSIIFFNSFLENLSKIPEITIFSPFNLFDTLTNFLSISNFNFLLMRLFISSILF